MRNFILDTPIKFSEAKVSLGGTDYELRIIKGNGGVFTVKEGGFERDQTSMTTQDMRAMYMLLTTKEEK